jgi:hypothetical protein
VTAVLAAQENRYKPIILKYDVDWLAIKDACMATIGKQAGKEPTDEWKKKLLLAEHSPLRRSVISVKWEEIPYFVMGHLVRHHVGCTPYVSTSRSDRTGVDRNERRQTDMVSMEMDFNIQSLIDISSRRLCLCADPETIKYWKGLVEVIREIDPVLAWALVPQCVHRGACMEKFGNCQYFNNFAQNLSKEELLDLSTRYEKYNEMILSRQK